MDIDRDFPVSLMLAELFFMLGIAMLQNLVAALPLMLIGFVCLLWSLRDEENGRGNMVPEGT